MPGIAWRSRFAPCRGDISAKRPRSIRPRRRFERNPLSAEVRRLKIFDPQENGQRFAQLSQRLGLQRAYIMSESGLREADQLVAMDARFLLQAFAGPHANLGAQAVMA